MADILSLAPGEKDIAKIVAVVNELVRRVMPSEDAAAGAAQVPVVNADLAQMAQATVKGRATGAGTGTPTDLTASELVAILNTLSTIGIGGTKLLILKQSDPSEGGEFYLEKSSGSSLAANVVIDLATNSFRVFEGGGSARGFNVDLTACAAGAGTSITGLLIDAITGIIKVPLNQTYRIVEDVPYGLTLTELTAKLASGTCTATLTINGTNVTNGAINVTTTQQSVSPSAANVAAANNRIELVITAASAPVDLSFTVKYVRS